MKECGQGKTTERGPWVNLAAETESTLRWFQVDAMETHLDLNLQF